MFLTYPVFIGFVIPVLDNLPLREIIITLPSISSNFLSKINIVNKCDWSFTTISPSHASRILSYLYLEGSVSLTFSFFLYPIVSKLSIDIIPAIFPLCFEADTGSFLEFVLAELLLEDTASLSDSGVH